MSRFEELFFGFAFLCYSFIRIDVLVQNIFFIQIYKRELRVDCIYLLK